MRRTTFEICEPLQNVQFKYISIEKLTTHTSANSRKLPVLILLQQFPFFLTNAGYISKVSIKRCARSVKFLYKTHTHTKQNDAPASHFHSNQSFYMLSNKLNTVEVPKKWEMLVNEKFWHPRAQAEMLTEREFEQSLQELNTSCTMLVTQKANHLLQKMAISWGLC